MDNALNIIQDQQKSLERDMISLVSLEKQLISRLDTSRELSIKLQAEVLENQKSQEILSAKISTLKEIASTLQLYKLPFHKTFQTPLVTKSITDLTTSSIKPLSIQSLKDLYPFGFHQ